MLNHQSNADQKSVAEAVADDAFHALTARSDKHPSPALLLALARLFIQNTAPSLWEIEQFQELMLNLLPFSDSDTHAELERLLRPNVHTPARVLTALETARDSARSTPPPPEMKQKPAPVPRKQPVYSVNRLKQILPLQIPKQMAQVVAMAAKRGDRHVLRSVLASHLSVSRPFADYLLTHENGLLLATALRALRMPTAVAHTIMLAREGLEVCDLVYLPQMVKSFENLEPEACRKRLNDWEMAFSASTSQPQGSRTAGQYDAMPMASPGRATQDPAVAAFNTRFAEELRKAG
jgi:hypothetical protein